MQNQAIPRYRRPAIALHWLIAALIFGGYILGLFMHDLPLSADKLRYYSWHKWIGVSVFLLALLRVLWRATHRPPALPAGPRWEHLAAHGTHGLLYVLMFAIPLSGWLHSSAAGYQTVYLGLIPLPDLLSKNEGLADTLADVHEWLNLGLITLLLLHAVAALQHHFLRRDSILLRMLPQSGARIWALVIAVAAAVAFGTVGTLMFADDDDEAGHDHHHQETAATHAVTAGEVTAEFRQMNVPVTGKFTAFHVESLQFDPDHLDDAKAVVVVDTASFDIGDADYNAEVRKTEWLDATAHPQARFTASKVLRKGAGYEASGELSLKGRSQTLTVPFTISTDDKATIYSGSFSVSRKDFVIGDADWNDVLDDAVLVRFKLTVPKS